MHSWCKLWVRIYRQHLFWSLSTGAHLFSFGEEQLTPRNTVNLVLDVEVDQRKNAAVESTCGVFPVLDSDRIGRAQRNATKGPWNSGQQVGDHEHIVPVVVVGRGHIGPTSASQRAEDAPEGHKAWQLGPRFARQQVPEADQGKARAGRDGYEELEDGSFGVSVAYRGGDGGEPLFWVAEPLVLDDFIEVKRQSDEEGAEKGSCKSAQEKLAWGSPGKTEVSRCCGACRLGGARNIL